MVNIHIDKKFLLPINLKKLDKNRYSLILSILAN